MPRDSNSVPGVMWDDVMRTTSDRRWSVFKSNSKASRSLVSKGHALRKSSISSSV